MGLGASVHPIACIRPCCPHADFIAAAGNIGEYNSACAGGDGRIRGRERNNHRCYLGMNIGENIRDTFAIEATPFELPAS